MRCTSCGTDNNDGQKFCRACGTPFEQQAPQQPVQNMNVGMGANPNPEMNMGLNPQPPMQNQMQTPMQNQMPMPMQNQMPTPMQNNQPKKSGGKTIGIIAGVIVGIFVFLYVLGSNVINSDHLTGNYKCSLSAADTNRGIYVAFNEDKTFSMQDATATIKGTYRITKEEYDSEEMIKSYALILRATYRFINVQVLTDPLEIPFAFAANENGFAALVNGETKTVYYCERQ